MAIIKETLKNADKNYTKIIIIDFLEQEVLYRGEMKDIPKNILKYEHYTATFHKDTIFQYVKKGEK